MGERRNVTGTAYALTVFAPIVAGQEETVRTVIESLPLGPNSPIARLGTVHTSRLQIFDRLVHQGPSQKRDSLNSNYLVFTAAFDGELEAFLDSVVDRLPEADSWWRHCIAYPGLADRTAFKRWIRHNQIHTSLFAVNSPNRTVTEVLESLALREKLLDFAISAQALSEHELHERFRRTFMEAR
ncbi:MAG: hypothetical protein ACREN6_03255 [Gemmatimonadaceae bacterium]